MVTTHNGGLAFANVRGRVAGNESTVPSSRSFDTRTRRYGMSPASGDVMSTKPVAEQVVPGQAGAESATASRGAARPRESWFHLCVTADAIRQAQKPEVKRSLLEPYFLALDAHAIGPAARVFAGVIAASDNIQASESRDADGANSATSAPPSLTISRTVTVGVIRGLTRASAERLLELTMKLGDLGDAAGEVFSGRLPSGLAVVDVESWLRDLAATETEEARVPLLREMLAKLSGVEARYLVRITDRGLDIGVDQRLVEEALANAFGAPIDLVRDAITRYHVIGVVAERARLRTLA